MSTGIQVSDECQEQFQNLKLGKKLKYIIYKINPENTHIVVDKTGEDKDYDNFTEQLPEAEPRYAIYDFEYQKGDDGIRNKICFVAWIPDNCKVKAKMIYAASKETIRKSLQGIATEVQATDASEIAYEAVLDRVSRGTA